MKRTFIAALALVLTFAFLMISCEKKEQSNYLATIINKNNLQEITTNLEQENLMIPEEILMFNNALNRLGGVNPDTLIGMTVGSLIESQREFMRFTNYRYLTATASRIETNLNYSIKYNGFKHSLDSVNNMEINQVFYEITNKTEKPISRINGFLQFFNQQNQIIKQIEINNMQQLGPNATLQFVTNFRYDPNDQRDSILVNYNKSLIVKWSPVIVQFTDGTMIEMKK